MNQMALVVFDLDGTLVDSAPDIQKAANRMLADEGLDPLDLPTIISFVGNGLPKLVERVMTRTGLDPARHAELTALTSAHYNASPSALTLPYDGVPEALTALQKAGHSLALCTNKPQEPARAILKNLKLAHFFECVVGGDTLPVKKPDPAPLLHVLEQLGGGTALYVGDSEVDAETAVRAKVPFTLFTKGYRKGPVDQIQHQHSFDAFAKLPDLVNQALAL